MKGPFKFPLIGSFPYILRNGGVNRMVKVFKKLYQDFGPIVELSAVGERSVVIFDPEVYLKVQRASGTCPVGATDALWMLHAYFEKRKRTDGSAMDFGTGEEWMRVRRLMQKGLFGPESAGEYGDRLHEVASEAADLIGSHPGSMQYFLQCLSFEMVSYSLLGTRMNSFTTNEPLLQATIRSMECASGMMMGPLQKLSITFETQLWRDWVQSVDYMLLRTQQLIQASKNNTPAQSSLSKPYIQILLEAGELTEEEIVTNIPGLMMAGFETVASTLHWTLIHLAENPIAQEKLYREIKSRLGETGSHKMRPFAHEDMSTLPYMKAVFREVHRMTPTAFAFLRRLDKPLTITSEISSPTSGAEVHNINADATTEKPDHSNHTNTYTLPAGAWLCFSPVGLATDPAFVPEPDIFWPERYAERCEGKLSRQERAQWAAFDHPLMRDGFGFGPRKCLGARLAEMEIYSAICAILSKHRISMREQPSGVGTEEKGQRARARSYEIANHAATYPSPAPTLIFTPRTSQ